PIRPIRPIHLNRRSTNMGRTAGRSPGDTRLAILEAAAELIRRDGLAAPISAIAAAAGVSKGGLLYHFATKEELLHGLAVSLVAEFHRRVELAIDPDDRAAGRLTRAYIRASFAESRDVDGLRNHIALAAHLMDDPDLREIVDAEAAHWRASLGADGLDPAVIRVVVAASDGVNTGPLWGAVLAVRDIHELERELLDLTRGGAAGPQ
ncbi:MAG: TetR family transcriptional regulator, partial [Leucobacter sp.]|nr:TetR family transcriptional regulator [Leucobacter sp.]